jgi:hypothetical protein
MLQGNDETENSLKITCKQFKIAIHLNPIKAIIGLEPETILVPVL